MWVNYRSVEVLPYSEFQQLVKENKVKDIVISSDEITGELKNPTAPHKRYFVTTRVDNALADELSKYSVKFSGRIESTFLPTLLAWIVPTVLFFGVWFLIMKRVSGGLGGGGLMSIGKSKAKVYVETDTKVTFKDVAGVDEATAELQETVSFLKDPGAVGRLGALGYTIQRPTDDRYLMTRGELENKMAVLMGGRASEHIIFNHFSTGAADDLAKIADIARGIITRYGMEPALGYVTYDTETHSALGPAGDAFRQRLYSDDTAREIDCAVRTIVLTAFERAQAILTDNLNVLQEAAKSLLEKETLDTADLVGLFKEIKQAPATYLSAIPSCMKPSTQATP
jgi:ATP-dependent Zn protease